MNFINNLFKKLFFGKSTESKTVVAKTVTKHYDAETMKKRSSVNTPRVDFGHNNRKDTDARRVQYIHMKDGRTRAIYHSNYTS